MNDRIPDVSDETIERTLAGEITTYSLPRELETWDAIFEGPKGPLRDYDKTEVRRFADPAYGALKESGELPDITGISLMGAFLKIYKKAVGVPFYTAHFLETNLWTPGTMWSYFSRRDVGQRLREEVPGYHKLVTTQAGFGRRLTDEEVTPPLLAGVWVYKAMETNWKDKCET